MSPRRTPGLAALVFILMAGCPDAWSQAAQRPFALGPAIREMCKPPGHEAAFCPALNAVVTRLLAEPRDGEWADRMERLIVDAFQVQSGQPIDIRSLECRRTLCAIEYAGDVDATPEFRPDAFDALHRSLDAVSGGIGYELPKAGRPAQVIGVMVWKRLDGPG